ncbi:MAG: hypothetical protein EON47_24150, partial [Acetobacteraceae bacterium]
MTPIDSLSYQGTPIRRRGTMLNLTDMWQAADRPANRRPSDWLLLEEAQRFRAQAGTHWTELDEPVAANAGHTGIWHLDTDGFIAPAFHLWCNTVVRAAMERPEEPPASSIERLADQIAQQLRQLHDRLDVLDRHAADLMLLQLSAQDLLLGERRKFSGETKAIIVKVTAAAPFLGQCPCCGIAPVLTLERQPAPGAEFDHVFHAGLNRPEHCWLICTACHHELTYGGYLVRFARIPEF